jgi:hypothetical protein
MQHRNQATHEARQGLFLLAQSANALDTLASRLEAVAKHYDRTGSASDARTACLISETAELLCFHADAIREGSGLKALTDENLDALRRAL